MRFQKIFNSELILKVWNLIVEALDINDLFEGSLSKMTAYIFFLEQLCLWAADDNYEDISFVCFDDIFLFISKESTVDTLYNALVKVKHTFID